MRHKKKQNRMHMPKTMAQQADRHALYQRAVQSPAQQQNQPAGDEDRDHDQ